MTAKSIDQRFHLLAIKWDLSKRDQERLRAVVKWRVERSTSSYWDYLGSLEWSSDLPSVLIWMELRREEAEAPCLECERLEDLCDCGRFDRGC